jgi:DNA-binding winged helix-turn-helix (wHTH) protein
MSGRVLFGGWQFDADSRELLGPRGPVHLSPKAFALLGVLLESRPRAVSKAELHDRLWANTFVSESNLASLVSEVRRALGEAAPERGFIRTVHGFGYAFRSDATAAARPPDPDRQAPTFYLSWGPGELRLEGGESVLGRAQPGSRCIDSPTVSRRHARVVVAGGGATIEDLGSRNGTYLNGRRLSGPAELADGDVIRLGSVSAVFRVVLPVDSTLDVADPDADA